MRLFTSNSKSALITLIFLVVAVFAADRIVTVVLTKIVDASQFRYSRLYSGNVDADVAIFGNSRGVHTFFAPELGEGSCTNVVNFSYNSLSTQTIEALLMDYLERNQTPRVVVLELSNVYTDQVGSNQLTPYMVPNSHLRNLLLSQRNTFLPWDALFTSYKFNSTLLLRTFAYLGRSDQTWINRLGPIQQKGVAPKPGQDKRVFELYSENLAALDRIVLELKRRDIPMIGVVAPYHNSITLQIQNPYDWIASIRERLPEGTPFLDLSKSIAGDAEFKDYLHLNLVGARSLIPTFNEQLARIASCKDTLQ
jgi:hypothetical protein